MGHPWAYWPAANPSKVRPIKILVFFSFYLEAILAFYNPAAAPYLFFWPAVLDATGRFCLCYVSRIDDQLITVGPYTGRYGTVLSKVRAGQR